MEKPIKASRVLNISKPAPRKNSLVKDFCIEGEIATKMETPEKNEKENRTIGKRASRCLKLEKPAPLKSKIAKIQDETSTADKPGRQIDAKKDSVISEPCKPAEKNAGLLIKEVLGDLEVSQNTSKQPESIQRQTRLLSQVSDDSGLGDMSSYSRQGSMLESLSENQDDLDWDDVDESAVTTFSFRTEHLKCLATTVNQIQPFNSLLACDPVLQQSQVSNTMQKVKRGRKFSHQNNGKVNNKPDISRSYSVPSSLSSNKETEFWDDEIDLSLGNAVETFQNVDKKTDRFRSFSAQSSREDIELAGSRRRHNTCTGSSSNGNDFHVIPEKRIQHSTPDVVASSAGTFSEDWESDIIQAEPSEDEDVDTLTARPCTPVNMKNFSENEIYCAINDLDTDLDSTPKAESVLSKFRGLNSSVKEKLDSAKLLMEHKNESANELENCDTESAVMKNLQSYKNYREKKESDMSSSAKSSTDTDLSSCASEDSFNEQLYAWELIEDLSDRVNSLKLDQESSDKETYDIKQEIPPKLISFPDDLDAIEAELEFMREDLDLSESFKCDKTKYINSVLKTAKSGLEQKAVVKVIRQPLSPFSPQNEVWKAEEGMQTGFCTAKGRRGMFRYYRQSQITDKESENPGLIQYSGKELLNLGTSKLSQKKPDSWLYLEKMYPYICLQNVSSYFDCEKYAQERDYVVEVFNIQEKSSAGPRRISSSLPDVTRPPPVVTSGGFGCPQGGFRAPDKSFSSEMSCKDTPEKNFVQPQRSSTPVAEFDNHFEADWMSTSNKNQPPKSNNEYVQSGNIQANNNKIDLDSKCDVSVRNDGSFRLFEAATSKIIPIKPAREFGVQRSISDPEGNRLSSARDSIKDEKQRTNKPVPDYRRSTSCRGFPSSDDADLILNKDLPEVCPW